MGTIIYLDNHRHPVGSYVWHNKYRVCRVVGIEGSYRNIRYSKITKNGLSFDNETVQLSTLQEFQHESIVVR